MCRIPASWVQSWLLGNPNKNRADPAKRDTAEMAAEVHAPLFSKANPDRAGSMTQCLTSELPLHLSG